MAKTRAASDPRSYFLRRMRKHFGTDPAKLVLVSQKYSPYDRPNIHLALERLLASKGVTSELEGILQITDTHVDAALHELVVAGGRFTQSLLGGPKSAVP